MRIGQLRLRNICQFNDFSYSFSPGITTVLGANGSGKSNLMNVGILGGLFGDWKLIGRKVTQIRRWDSFDGDEAKIELELAIQGKEIRISRSIVGTKTEHRLWVDGEEISGASQILDLLESRGIYPNFFVEVCYCPQGATSWYFQASPQEHRRRLDQILGLAEAEYIRRQLKEGATKIKSKIPTFFDPEQLQKSIDSCQASIDETKKKIQALPSVNVSTRDYNQAVSHLGDLKSRLSKLLAAKKLEQLNKQRDYIADRLSWVEGIVHTYKDKLSVPVIRLEKDCDLWQQLLVKVSQQVVEKGQDNVNTNRLPRLLKLHGRLSGRISLLKKILDDPHTCPTCGQVRFSLFNTPVVTKLLRKYQRWNRKVIEEIFHLAMQEGVRLKEEAYQQDEFRSFLSTIANFEKIYGSLKNLQALIRRSRFYQYKLPTIRHQLESTLESLQVNNQATVEEQLSEQELRAEVQKSEELVKELQKEVEEAQKIIREKDFLQGRLKSLQEQLSGLKDSLNKAKKAKRKADKLLRWQDRLQGLADIFSPQHLPSFYRDKKLAVVIKYINDCLYDLGVSWRVVGADSFWEVRDNSGQIFPAGFLSGGQRVLLLMAIKFAMMRLFPQRSGILILDEPFDGLDETNLQALLQQFEQLRTWVGEQGLQLIMSTHHHLVSQLGDYCLVIDNVGAQHETHDLLAS